MNEVLEPKTQTLEPILTPLESERLDVLEQTVTRDKDAFLRVGAALYEIRESRLYRQDFKSFDEYCDYRWEFTRQYARYLIKALETSKNLETIGFKVASERQARTLDQLEPQDQRVVVQVLRAVTGKEHPSSAELSAFAETVQKLHNTGMVTNPDTLEEMPWDELPESARMSVLKANVSEITHQQVLHTASLGTWGNMLLNHAKNHAEGQETVIRIYRDSSGNVRVRARVEAVSEYGAILAEGEEKHYIKAAAMSLLEEVKHGA